MCPGLTSAFFRIEIIRVSAQDRSPELHRRVADRNPEGSVLA
jgi:hypothetical protein